MIKKICDECKKEVKVLWTLEAYNEELEDYLKPKKELCEKCALKHLTKLKKEVRNSSQA